MTASVTTIQIRAVDDGFVLRVKTGKKLVIEQAFGGTSIVNTTVATGASFLKLDLDLTLDYP